MAKVGKPGGDIRLTDNTDHGRVELVFILALNDDVRREQEKELEQICRTTGRWCPTSPAGQAGDQVFTIESADRCDENGVQLMTFMLKWLNLAEGDFGDYIRRTFGPR